MVRRFRTSVLFLSAATLWAGATPTQQLAMVPPYAGQREGNSQYGIAFGTARIRFQQLIGAPLHGLQPGATLQAVAIRRDGLWPATFAAKSVPYELWVAESPRGAMEISAEFAQNRGPSAMRVFGPQDVQLPLAPPPASLPAPLQILWPFDRPFPITGSGKSLLIEWIAQKPQPELSDWIVDREWLTPLGGQLSLSIGQPCAGAGHLEVDEGTLFPGAAVWYWSNDVDPGLVGAPFLAVLGSSSQWWGSVRLPFDLAALGAPGCHLYTDLVAVQVGRIAAVNGDRDNYDVFWPTPAQASLLGARFTSQVWILAAQRNPLGVVTSNGEDCRFSNQMLSLELSYCYSREPSASSGWPFSSRGVVLGLQWR
jgi:hypothetical protein